MLIAALTGGIGTGKSTISQMFKDLGAYVFDADITARQVVEAPSPILAELARTFGGEALDSQGNLRRHYLREIIFQDARAREKLNRIMHPAIEKMLRAQVDKVTDPDALVLIDIPLLFEIGWEKHFSIIILAYAPEAVQLKRLMHRDKLTEKEARMAIAAQWPIEKKKQKSQFIIDNSGLLADTLAQVQNTWLALQNRLH